MSERVVILGAGHAGGSAAAFLRQYGFEGEIVLVGDEPLAPYQRPPLSKAWLKGEAGGEDLALKSAEFYAEANIDFRPNVSAVSLKRSEKTVQLSTGESLGYDHLIIATGARARPLPVPGADLANVLPLRTAADAEALKHLLAPGARVAVIGGGYIGLEVAASARALGAQAVVLEREARLLARSSCPALSEFFLNLHRAHGVTVELGCSVVGLEGQDGKVSAVALSDGRTIACDAAVVGVGVVPNDEIAKDAGLDCANGIVVDLSARTGDPAVFAIGDVAHRPLPPYDRMMRLESVANALEQAKQVACAIVGRPIPAPEVTWNWSDQYDVKLQIGGMPFDADGLVLRGDPAAGKFAAFHLKGDVIQAVEAVNDPQSFMGGRLLIAKRTPVSREKLANPAVSIKEVAA